MPFVKTELLSIAYETGGPPEGYPVFLLHGWPDVPEGWRNVARALHDHGYRTIAPYLRGSIAILSANTPRFAGAVAMAQDVIDSRLLGVERFAVIGHDWGARIAYTLAALFPRADQFDRRSRTCVSAARRISPWYIRPIKTLLVPVLSMH